VIESTPEGGSSGTLAERRAEVIVELGWRILTWEDGWEPTKTIPTVVDDEEAARLLESASKVDQAERRSWGRDALIVLFGSIAGDDGELVASSDHYSRDDGGLDTARLVADARKARRQDHRAEQRLRNAAVSAKARGTGGQRWTLLPKLQNPRVRRRIGGGERRPSARSSRPSARARAPGRRRSRKSDPPRAHGREVRA
jgi:hypothetical protein